MQGCVITESDYKRLLQLLHGWIQRHPHEEHQLLNVVALIGKRIGGIVEYHDQNRRQQWRVESLQYQPEAAGRFDL